VCLWQSDSYSQSCCELAASNGTLDDREERCVPGPNEFVVFFGFATNLGATGSLSVSHYSDPEIKNPTWKDLRLPEEAKYSGY
jgi:hypothetical protein